MSDKEKVQNNIDDSKEQQKESAEKPLSDEVKQRIAGLAVIGVITVGLCITGFAGRFSGDSIPAASVSSSVSSLADEESSAADSSSVNSVEESSQEDESSYTTTTADESADTTTADESSEQATQDSKSDETSAESEKPKTEDTTTSESSQTETDPPQTDPPQTDPPQTDPPKTDPPKTDPPKTDPPKTDPPKSDPPKTDPPKSDPPKTDPPKSDPPAQNGGLSANCAVTNSWDEDGKKCFQISITINNGTSSDTSGWTVSINVPSGTEIINSWNGNFSVNGDTVTITNVDYNGVIAAGGQSSDVGLIVKSPSEFTPSASVK